MLCHILFLFVVVVLQNCEKNTDQVWIFCSLLLFCIYSWICSYWVVKIIQKCDQVSKISVKLFAGDLRRSMCIDARMDVRPKHSRAHIQSSFENFQNKPNMQQTRYTASSILWITVSSMFRTLLFIIFLICFLIFLILPVVLYNLYHSLPMDNNLPIIGKYDNKQHYFIVSKIISNFTSFIIAIQQWFLITPAVNILIKLLPFPNFKQYKKSIELYKNFIIQLFRNVAFIIIPILSLIIFDDKCFQNWKQFWPTCDPYDTNEYLGSGPNGCIPFEYRIFDKRTETKSLCFEICAKSVFPHRCVRQLFQVLGPLYTIKATVALLFPFLYHFTRQLKLQCGFVINGCGCCCCKRKSNDHDNDNDIINDKNAMDVEYIGLISTVEILIVFGWGLPILIPIYNVVILGYGLVFYYWLNLNCHSHSNHDHQQQIKFKIKDGKYINIIGKWLLLSILIQQLFGLCFYWLTQSGYCKILLLINAFGLFIYFFKTFVLHC